MYMSTQNGCSLAPFLVSTRDRHTWISKFQTKHGGDGKRPPHSPSLRLGLDAPQPSRRHHAQSLLGPSFHVFGFRTPPPRLLSRHENCSSLVTGWGKINQKLQREYVHCDYQSLRLLTPCGPTDPFGTSCDCISENFRFDDQKFWVEFRTSSPRGESWRVLTSALVSTRQVGKTLTISTIPNVQGLE